MNSQTFDRYRPRLPLAALSFFVASNAVMVASCGGELDSSDSTEGMTESAALPRSDSPAQSVRAWEDGASLKSPASSAFNLGNACSTNTECLSSYCIDGVCCNTPCADTCMACSAAKKSSGADGLCGAIAYDKDPDEECARGACNGKNDCQFYNGVPCSLGTQCLSRYCIDGVCCNNICMGECMTCTNGKKGGGYDGVCGTIATNTNPDGECVGGTCNGSGACSTPQTKAVNGASCISAAQCQSGYCADGVCCDSWCLGPCQACTAAIKGSGMDGVCGPIAQNVDPENECFAGSCDGSGACKRMNGAVCATTNDCASGICVDNVCCESMCGGNCEACSTAKKRNGESGTCRPISSGQDPDGECNPGECNGSGTCNQTQTPFANGSACVAPGQCASGSCVDGVCCDTPCSDTCMACTAAKKGSGADGVCGSIADDRDPDEECSGGACNGKNVCQFYNGMACAFSSQCLSRYCVDGVCCNNICMGECMTCTNAKKGGGYDGVCGAIAANTNPDGECVGGTCNGSGACSTPQTKAANGAACISAAQCQSGYCADGVCCDSWCLGTCVACSAAVKGNGVDGECGPIAQGMDPEDDCVDGACYGTGTCKRINGATCSTNAECGSGHCVDGVCCNAACMETCNACNLLGSVGTCSPIPAGQSDANATVPCLAVCNGAGLCDNTGAACTSGSQCSSLICKDLVCLSPKPANGPNQWITETRFYNLPCSIAYISLGQIAARNYGDSGVVINGATPSQGNPGILDGGFDGDGFPFLHSYDPSNGSYIGQNWRKLGRGGVESRYTKTGMLACAGSWPYGGGTSYATALIGANDAGQAGAILMPCGPYYNGPWGLKRYSASHVLEFEFGGAGNWGGPIVLGPIGEFYRGSATSLFKYDVNAVAVWSKAPTLAGSVTSSAWDVDAVGNVLIALSFSGSIDYGLGPMVAAGPKDLALLQLDPNGNPVWQTHFGNATFTMGTVNLSRTGAGDMAVWGNYTGVMDFGTGPLQGGTFVAKFDSTGQALWHVNITNADGLLVSGDTSGAVYLGSSADAFNLGWGAINFNSCTLTVAKYRE